MRSCSTDGSPAWGGENQAGRGGAPLVPFDRSLAGPEGAEIPVCNFLFSVIAGTVPPAGEDNREGKSGRD